MNENTVDNRAAPKTILYSCCDPARLSTRWSAFGGLSRESQSSVTSSIPVVPSRWENWRPMSQIYASGEILNECYRLVTTVTVAVGTTITDRPPHRSVRASTHTALT